MKLLTFAIPCYNSAEYMSKCIESLLPGGEDVEILIVNDGSKDDTSKIAHEYEKKYPTICKAIDKENGGHGSAVNTGIEHATGLYFKVVDSDDWVKDTAYEKILEVLREQVGGKEVLDMLQEFAPFKIEKLHVIGGGSANDYMSQLTADTLGIPVVAGPVEATAIGNVMIQAQAAGLVSDRWEMRRLIAETFSVKTFYPSNK